MRRPRFQHGWLKQRKTKEGIVWHYNFREYQQDGSFVERSIKLGQFPNETEAKRAAQAKRLQINEEVSPETPSPLMTIELLASHYTLQELSETQEEGKASTTKDAYDSYLKNHIIPRWGAYTLSEVKAVAVEQWLRQLQTKGEKPRPMAKGSKAKIRNIMHALYEHAIRHEFSARNPITQVRQSGKRQRIPDILMVDEFRALLEALGQRERTMILTDAGSGLRRSELFALKWGDIDFSAKQVDITRSIVHNTKRERIGTCKTEVSRKPVPLDDFMLEELRIWFGKTEYQAPEHWVFASPHKNGKYPLWPDTVLKRHIRPAAVKAKLTKHIGWHTFRHTYSTLLKANGEDVKVVQELLRHASSRITLDTYTQAITPAKRAAQSKVVGMLLRKPAQQDSAGYCGTEDGNARGPQGQAPAPPDGTPAASSFAPAAPARQLEQNAKSAQNRCRQRFPRIRGRHAGVGEQDSAGYCGTAPTVREPANS